MHFIISMITAIVGLAAMGTSTPAVPENIACCADAACNNCAVGSEPYTNCDECGEYKLIREHSAGSLLTYDTYLAALSPEALQNLNYWLSLWSRSSLVFQN